MEALAAGMANATARVFGKELSDGLAEGYAYGCRMAAETIALTLLLELLSHATVRGLCKKDRKLYFQGLWANVQNNAVLGPIVYAVATQFFVSGPREPSSSWPLMFGVIFVHAIGYYMAHRAMHTRTLYWAHRFHHRFNTHVPPSSANAVSLVEYGLAYMLPFVVACSVLRPDPPALRRAVAVVSVCNLLIHTPPLEPLSQRLPWWLVSTEDHIDHHRKLTKNFGAPTVSVDRILACFFGEPDVKGYVKATEAEPSPPAKDAIPVSAQTAAHGKAE